ncbi:MAG: FMN-binding protein [Christensenellales bacterium]|jgi:uncharacterized protein with FMN-binding domain|nr:FMN-binding protein [Clostridiales bacterium]
MTKKKKGWITALIIIGVIVIAIAVGGIALVGELKKNLDYLVNLEFEQIDLNQIQDGVYEGEYSLFPVSAKVAVNVSGHKIIKVTIIDHGNGKGEAAEVIVEKVVEEQKLEVDSISGATYSSRVILLAIEDALKKAQRN